MRDCEEMQDPEKAQYLVCAGKWHKSRVFKKLLTQVNFFGTSARYPILIFCYAWAYFHTQKNGFSWYWTASNHSFLPCTVNSWIDEIGNRYLQVWKCYLLQFSLYLTVVVQQKYVKTLFLLLRVFRVQFHQSTICTEWRTSWVQITVWGNFLDIINYYS